MPRAGPRSKRSARDPATRSARPQPASAPSPARQPGSRPPRRVRKDRCPGLNAPPSRTAPACEWRPVSLARSRALLGVRGARARSLHRAAGDSVSPIRPADDAMNTRTQDAWSVLFGTRTATQVALALAASPPGPARAVPPSGGRPHRHPVAEKALRQQPPIGSENRLRRAAPPAPPPRTPAAPRPSQAPHETPRGPGQHRASCRAPGTRKAPGHIAEALRRRAAHRPPRNERARPKPGSPECLVRVPQKKPSLFGL